MNRLDDSIQILYQITQQLLVLEVYYQLYNKILLFMLKQQ